jgi:broad specificity phosphatase PhoE
VTVSEIILVRHASTTWSSAGRHTSRTEVDLDAPGRAGAMCLRRALPAGPYVRVLSSPRRRAIETCKLAGLGHQVEVNDDLTEWDYGELEGLTTPEIRAVKPGWSLFADGPPGGELLTDVASRVDRVIELVRTSPGRSAIFSHGHLLRVLAARWVGLSPALGAVLALDPASVSVLGYERETPVIRRWNVAARRGSPTGKASP